MPKRDAHSFKAGTLTKLRWGGYNASEIDNGLARILPASISSIATGLPQSATALR